MPSSFKRFGEKLKQQLNINSGSTKVRDSWGWISDHGVPFATCPLGMRNRQSNSAPATLGLASYQQCTQPGHDRGEMMENRWDGDKGLCQAPEAAAKGARRIDDQGRRWVKASAELTVNLVN
eukprot:scaffold143879_cov18-Tisochrysis_lutea.AAC.1